MKLKNPVFFILLLIFSITNIIDGITALFILDGEANIIFLLTGSIWYVILLKIFVIIFLIYIYKTNIFPSNFYYYMIMLAIIFGTLLFSLGTYSNIQGIMNPEILEVTSQISVREKTNFYVLISSIFYIMPCALSLLSFKCYEWSLKYIKLKKR